jgi:hypothetical protein
MVGKLTRRAEELLAAAAELAPDERPRARRWLAVPAPAWAPRSPQMTAMPSSSGASNAFDAVTLSLAEVEQSLRDELDF